MAYVDMTVEIDLCDVDDQELIDSLESRGWYVGEEPGWVPNEDLNEDEITAILERFQMSVPGTVGHSIYEKLRKI